MIQLANTPNSPLVATMSAPGPRIYLDHCVVQTIARVTASREAFEDAFSASGGTLLVSWAGLLELFSLSDGPKRSDIDALLESIGTSYCFLEVTPRVVIENEKRASGPDASPFVDVALLDLLMKEWDGRHPPTLRYMTELTRRLPSIQTTLSEMRRTFKRNVKASVDEARALYRSAETIRGAPDGCATERPDESRTAQVYRAVLAECVRAGVPFEAGDSIDLLHSVVASANADLVALDKKWALRMNRLACPAARATVVSVVQVERIIQFLTDPKWANHASQLE